jgi:hypothetical protein
VLKKIKAVRKALRAARVSQEGGWVDPELNAIRPMFSAGDLDLGRKLLAATRDDHNLRSVRLSRLSRLAVPHVEQLGALSAANPDDPELALLLGATRIDHGWEVRSGLRAKYVSREQFEEFWFILGGAHEPLTRAAELLPDDPAPWNVLQWRGLGLQVDRSELDEVWAELVKRSPKHFAGHYSRAQVLCAKWKGSNEELLEFVHTAAADAGPGDPRAALLVEGHFEVWMDADAPRRGYFKSREVIDPITDAAERWIVGAAPGPCNTDAHHLFGAAFYLADDDDRARRHLSQVDPKAIPRTLPWAYLNTEPVIAYLAVRDQLGL